MDSSDEDLYGLVHTVASLINAAAPMIEQLNSPGTPDKFRTFLRAAVGSERYFEVTTHLNQMCSKRAWDLAHAGLYISPELVAKINSVLQDD